jgi:hypothetical protein
MASYHDDLWEKQLCSVRHQRGDSKVTPPLVGKNSQLKIEFGDDNEKKKN